jgi:hypothetical protein
MINKSHLNDWQMSWWTSAGPAGRPLKNLPMFVSLNSFDFVAYFIILQLSSIVFSINFVETISR